MSTDFATFKVTVVGAGPSGVTGTRQLRRAYLPPNVLREHKLTAGEWVILSSETSETVIVVAQLWPRVGVQDDCACPCPTVRR